VYLWLQPARRPLSLFDWFSGRRSPNPPPDLRDALIPAVAAKDWGAFANLINANAAAIRDAFPEWTRVPAEVRNDSEAMGRYAEALFAVATAFEQSGDASLMTRLRNNGPAGQWNQDLQTAQTLIAETRASEAVTLLRTVLDSMESHSGTGVAHFRPRVLGKLGVALYHSGDRREAVRVTREALALCRSQGDEEGIAAYTTNLQTIGTYEMRADDGTGQNVTVTFLDDQRRPLTLEEIRDIPGTVTWEVTYHVEVPPEAHRLHQEGRAAGARGEYDAAVALLSSAAELAPLWPYPVYDRAFTHLFKRDFDAALSDFRKTMELAPQGFFVVEVAIDTLTREAAGEFPRGLYGAFSSFEHLTKDQQRSVAERLVQNHPSFAAGWNVHASFAADPLARLEAIEQGLAAKPDRVTRGFLMVNRALAMSSLDDTEGAASILQRLLSDATGSITTRAGAQLALARMQPPHAQ
jgi:tetratricopeptide (TPR) repeat protein